MFREALHTIFPHHQLALHTTDIQNTHHDEYEKPTKTTREIGKCLGSQHPTENFPPTLLATPSVIWLPTSNPISATWIRNIRTLLRSTPDNQLIAIATHTITHTPSTTERNPGTYWMRGCPTGGNGPHPNLATVLQLLHTSESEIATKARHHTWTNEQRPSYSTSHLTT